MVGEEEADRRRNRGANRGRIVHDALETWVGGGTPVFDSPMTAECFRKIADVFNNTVENLILQEQTVFSDKLRIAGRCDLAATFLGLGPGISDAKTADKSKRLEWIESHFLQTCFYSQAIFEMTNGKQDFPWLVVVIGNQEDPKAQTFVQHRNDWIERLQETVAWYYDTVWEKP